MVTLAAVLSVLLVIIALLVQMSQFDAMKDLLRRQLVCMNVHHAVTLSGTTQPQLFVKLNQRTTSQFIQSLQFKHALITCNLMLHRRQIQNMWIATQLKVNTILNLVLVS